MPPTLSNSARNCWFRLRFHDWEPNIHGRFSFKSGWGNYRCRRCGMEL